MNNVGLLSAQFDFYHALLDAEFRGLSTSDIYHLAFSRLLRPSPAEALLDPKIVPGMLGADERELLLPVLKSILAEVPSESRILDLGAGDGQTVALALDAVPEGARFVIEDPDEPYLAAYAKVLARREDLILEAAHPVTVDAFLDRADDQADRYDLVLAIHMLYFAQDPVESIGRMIDCLAPGGCLLLIVADGATGFTSRSVYNHLELTDGAAARSWINRERKLLDALGAPDADAPPKDVSSQITAATGRTGIQAECRMQSSRLYGVDVGDLIALGFITGLAEKDSRPVEAKILSMRDLLERQPESVSLRLETDGLRNNYLSVSEPQMILECWRVEDGNI